MRIWKIGLVGCALALTACETTPGASNMVSYVGSPLAVVEKDKGMWTGLHRLDKDHIAFTWSRITRYTANGGTVARKACHITYITEHNGGPQENWRDFVVVDQRKKCGFVG